MSIIYEPNTSVPFVWNDIEAYTNATSVAQGETIQFHVYINTDIENFPFSVDIVRIEETEIHITTLNGTSFRQPTNANPWENGCGWQSSLEWHLPADVPSGAYKATFTTELPSGTVSTSVIFFVRASETWSIYKDTVCLTCCYLGST